MRAQRLHDGFSIPFDIQPQSNFALGSNCLALRYLRTLFAECPTYSAARGVGDIARMPCARPAPLAICETMYLRLLLDDVRQLPTFMRMGAALRRSSDAGRETFGVLVREQAQRIPDRVLLRFETETVTY